MSDLKHLPHIYHGTKDEIEKLPPLKEDKDPFTAAILGFLFGPIGIGIYLKSWRDFFLCLAALVLLMFTIFLAPIGWLFSAFYGFYRVDNSNRKRWRNST